MLEAGRQFDDYLMKPIDLRQLLKKIHALLGIEWLYHAEPARPAPSADATPLVIPPDRDIDELIGLGEIGHIRAIVEKLGEIEKSSSEYGEFVERMRVIVDAFDLKSYAAALDTVRGRNA